MKLKISQRMYCFAFIAFFSCSPKRGVLNDNLNQGGNGSILASAGTMTAPEGYTGNAFVYKLICENITLSSKIDSNIESAIKFSPKPTEKIEVGTKCRMEAWGNEDSKFEFKDNKKDGDLIKYHFTTNSDLTKDRELSFHSVPNFIFKEKANFLVFVKVTNLDSLNIKGNESTAALRCNNIDIANSKFDQEKGFIFEFKPTHFKNDQTLSCDQLTLMYGDNAYTSEAIQAELTSSQNINKNIDTIVSLNVDNTITTKVGNNFDGSWVGKCESSPNAIADEAFYAYTIKIVMDENKLGGQLIKIKAFYKDNNCTTANTNNVESNSYKFAITSVADINDALRITITDTKSNTNYFSIMMSANNELKFGEASNEFWTGSTNEINLVKLSTEIFIKK